MAGLVNYRLTWKHFFFIVSPRNMSGEEDLQQLVRLPAECWLCHGRSPKGKTKQDQWSSQAQDNDWSKGFQDDHEKWKTNIPQVCTACCSSSYCNVDLPWSESTHIWYLSFFLHLLIYQISGQSPPSPQLQALAQFSSPSPSPSTSSQPSPLCAS